MSNCSVEHPIICARQQGLPAARPAARGTSSPARIGGLGRCPHPAGRARSGAARRPCWARPGHRQLGAARGRRGPRLRVTRCLAFFDSIAGLLAGCWLVAVHQAEAQTPAQHADVHVVPASTEERPAAVVAAQPQSSFEARFFADCSDRPRIRVHSDSSAGDAHAVLYTAGNLMELEVIRLADLVIDLPIGRGVRPLERTVDGIRAGYDRLGHQLLLRRFGEFVDALQIRELSLGDAAATYSGGTGGAVSPGSGTVVRVDKLIDWVQHVTGDVNGGLGLLAGRPAGLVSWRLPGRAVDQAQLGVIRVFHLVSVTVARALDRGVAGVEDGLEVVLNLSRPEAHRRTTVFVRVPLEIYQAHQAWIGRQGRRIYAGSAEELRGLTHAELFHGRGKRWVPARAQWPTGTSHIILVMSARTFTSAPPALAPYVIPAAWVGQEPEPSDQI